MPDLLLEIGVEELPPTAIDGLRESLGTRLADALVDAGLVADDATPNVQHYASPRRLAVVIKDVSTEQPDRDEQRLGPAVAAAYKDGKPTPAALGFAKSCGVDLEQLSRVDTPKGERLAYSAVHAGQPAANVVPDLVKKTIESLPIPKPMRWGSGEHTFVRPVHWLVLTLGEQVLPLSMFGIAAGNQTRGHRILGSENVAVTATNYVETLRRNFVIVDSAERRRIVAEQIASLVSDSDLTVDQDDALLDEVNKLVEWPVCLLGTFDERYLAVPEEMLVASLRGHQKSFAIRKNGVLTNRFIAVANIASTQPDLVREGMERVIAPRLADAQFFWERDLAIGLEERRSKLDDIVFQRALGSIGDKTERVQALGQWLAGTELSVDAELLSRAAHLSRCDLVTDTVGEFPELQGIAGRQLASAHNEPAELASALDEFYKPRYSGDTLPSTPTGTALAISDRLDTLAGIFAAGLIPKGSRDPFALRRAAVGLYRLIVATQTPLDLVEGLKKAVSGLPGKLSASSEIVDQIASFVWDRARALLATRGIDGTVFEAVLAVQSRMPADFELRVAACDAFRASPEAAALAAANKRIVNLLRKAKFSAANCVSDDADGQAEKELATAMDAVAASVEAAVSENEYGQALDQLSTLRPSVDRFFDDVMVMSDDVTDRTRRLSLLFRLRALFLMVADISGLEISTDSGSS